MPISGISQGLGIGGGASATISGAPSGGGGGGFPQRLEPLMAMTTGTGATADSMAFDGTANTGIPRFTMSCWVNHSTTQDGVILEFLAVTYRKGDLYTGTPTQATG